MDTTQAQFLPTETAQDDQKTAAGCQGRRPGPSTADRGGSLGQVLQHGLGQPGPYLLADLTRSDGNGFRRSQGFLEFLRLAGCLGQETSLSFQIALLRLQSLFLPAPAFDLLLQRPSYGG